MASERVVKQIGIPDDLRHKLKMHALERRKDLQEVADEAMLDFFKTREEVKKTKGRAPDYITSPTDAEVFNVRLSKSVASKVDKVADEDAATARRLVYTGLVHYARKNKLTSE